MREFIIKLNDSGQRLDKFLQKAIPSLSKGMLYKSIRTKNIKLNGKRTDGAVMLSEGDVVRCYINDDFFENKTEASNKLNDKKYLFLKAPLELKIVYEDDNIIIVNKPVGLVVHDDDRKSEDTLIARVLRYLYESGKYSPEAENSFMPALCNRLDRNTSGLVIAAKNAAALREVNRLIRNNSVHKSYLCITYNIPPKKHDTLHAYHYRAEGSKSVKISLKKQPNYHEIITRYNVLAENGKLALLKIDLITGRTHQIRAHMAFINTPLLGDNKYGNVKINKQYNIKYQLLCAYNLTFESEKDSILAYLNGKRFKAELPLFVNKYFPDFKL